MTTIRAIVLTLLLSLAPLTGVAQPASESRMPPLSDPCDLAPNLPFCA